MKIIPPATSTHEEPAVVILPNGIRLQFAALTPALLVMLLETFARNAFMSASEVV